MLMAFKPPVLLPSAASARNGSDEEATATRQYEMRATINSGIAPMFRAGSPVRRAACHSGELRITVFVVTGRYGWRSIISVGGCQSQIAAVNGYAADRWSHVVFYSTTSLRKSSPSATDKSRLPRRCSGHACSCRCGPPWVPLIPARHRASGIAFCQPPPVIGTVFQPGSWLSTAPRCATGPAPWTDPWGRPSFLVFSPSPDFSANSLDRVCRDRPARSIPVGIRSRFEIAQADNIRVLWAHCTRDSRDRARAGS